LEHEHATMIGFPTMEWYVQEEGKIIYNDVRGLIGVDEGLTGGASGSPVFDDDGNVIGMVNKIDQRIDYTVIVSGVYLKVFLKSYYEAEEAEKLKRLMRK